LTRTFFSSSEFKNSQIKKTVIDRRDLNQVIQQQIDEHTAENWKIAHRIEIKGCPTIFFKQKENKKAIILASMDNKVFIFSEIYIKEITKTKDISKIGGKSAQLPRDTDLVEFFHVLYVFYKNGSCLFEYQFKEQTIDSDLLTSIFTAIGEVLKEATGNFGNIKEISQENLYILFEHETLFSSILISDRNDESIRLKLKAFNQIFLSKYKLERWSGEINQFRNATEILTKIFGIKTDENKVNISSYQKKRKATEDIEDIHDIRLMTTDIDEISPLIEEKTYYYLCEHCDQWYKVYYEGRYSCIYCNNELINKTDEIDHSQE